MENTRYLTVILSQEDRSHTIAVYDIATETIVRQASQVGNI